MKLQGEHPPAYLCRQVIYDVYGWADFIIFKTINYNNSCYFTELNGFCGYNIVIAKYYIKIYNICIYYTFWYYL